MATFNQVEMHFQMQHVYVVTLVCISPSIQNKSDRRQLISNYLDNSTHFPLPSTYIILIMMASRMFFLQPWSDTEVVNKGVWRGWGGGGGGGGGRSVKWIRGYLTF